MAPLPIRPSTEASRCLRRTFPWLFSTLALFCLFDVSCSKSSWYNGSYYGVVFIPFKHVAGGTGDQFPVTWAYSTVYPKRCLFCGCISTPCKFRFRLWTHGALVSFTNRAWLSNQDSSSESKETLKPSKLGALGRSLLQLSRMRGTLLVWTGCSLPPVQDDVLMRWCPDT